MANRGTFTLMWSILLTIITIPIVGAYTGPFRILNTMNNTGVAFVVSRAIACGATRVAVHRHVGIAVFSAPSWETHATS